MSHSLGEIDSLARRAARGAGMSWGLAEEAGQAVAWLCAHGLPGPEYLATRLQNRTEVDSLADHPLIEEDTWRAHTGTLCPIATGAALSDAANIVSKTDSLRLVKCDAPFLLLPFLASIAHRMGVTIGLKVPDHEAVCSPKGLYLVNKPPDSVIVQADDVTVLPNVPIAGTHVPTQRRAQPTKEALKILNLLADRMYAPETEARRRTGAGELG
ncbi:MAG: DUF3726 domain-containing protein [Pseudomonadota bacterium]